LPAIQEPGYSGQVRPPANVWIYCETVMPNQGRPQAIVGFHQDELGDWIADLACGHTQHVRHRPPWELRPWVTTAAGRQEHLNQILVCVKCSRPAE
jgi:Protein of unknown function (DUF3565)